MMRKELDLLLYPSSTILSDIRSWLRTLYTFVMETVFDRGSLLRAQEVRRHAPVSQEAVLGAQRPFFDGLHIPESRRVDVSW